MMVEMTDCKMAGEMVALLVDEKVFVMVVLTAELTVV